MSFKPYSTEEAETIYKAFLKQHEMHVPQQGKADTVYGEIFRTVGGLSQAHRRSGSDEFWLMAEEKSLGNFAGYLSCVVDLEPLLSRCVFFRLRGNEYGNFLTNLQQAAMDWTKQHGNERNTIDADQVSIKSDWNLSQCDECGEMTKVDDLENDGFGQHSCPECANKRYQEERKNRSYKS